MTGIRKALRRFRRDDRGGPALEFALVTPVILVVMGGMTDFSLANWTQGVLANSVAEGAAYAMLAGPGVTAANIQAVVSQKLSLAASSVTVSGPACRCLSNAVPSVATSQTCGATCADGTLAGKYVTISAQFTYTPVMPSFSQLSTPVLTETVEVRLK